MICIHQKYYSCNKMKENRMTTICSTYGEQKNVYCILVRNPKWKRPLIKAKHSCKNNIKMERSTRMEECGIGASGSVQERTGGRLLWQSTGLTGSVDFLTSWEREGVWSKETDRQTDNQLIWISGIMWLKPPRSVTFYSRGSRCHFWANNMFKVL